MERTLQHQWREAPPARLEFDLGGEARVLTIADPFAVLLTEMSDVFRVVNFKEGSEVMEVSCSSCDNVPEALLSKDVLLVVLDVGGVSEVLAWIVPTRQEIFNKKFPCVWPVFDQHNKQVMLGSNTRLEISGNTVIESTVNLPPPPGSGFLRLLAFSHPHYVTRGPSALWKMDGTTIVKLGTVDSGRPVFCPAGDILIIWSATYRDQIKVSFYNLLTSQLIKVRDLTRPAGFSVLGDESHCVNANQLVLLGRQLPRGWTVLLVYELDVLLSQAADEDISPRVFQIAQTDWDLRKRIDVNKTSISAVQVPWERKKIITLDFWNCET